MWEWVLDLHIYTYLHIEAERENGEIIQAHLRVVKIFKDVADVCLPPAWRPNVSGRSAHTPTSHKEHRGRRVWVNVNLWGILMPFVLLGQIIYKQRVMWKMRAINQRYALHTVNCHESSTAPWRTRNIGISGAIKTWVWQWHQCVFCLCKHTRVASAAT